MITLHIFGPTPGLPDPSPFVMKAEMLLKLSGLPYETKVTDLRTAPKGKLPFIHDGDTVVADSTFIRHHLEERHGIDFYPGLSATEKATACAFEKMCEDHLYWAVVYDRWLIESHFERGPAAFFQKIPALIRPFILRMVLKKVRANLHGHGLGRHSWPEIVRLVTPDIDALATLLGDKNCMIGDRPTGLDAVAFPFVAGLLPEIYSDSELYAAAKRHANLVAYRDRMMAQYFPAFA